VFLKKRKEVMLFKSKGSGSFRLLALALLKTRLRRTSTGGAFEKKTSYYFFSEVDLE
jgi:hypothetical protein